MMTYNEIRQYKRDLGQKGRAKISRNPPPTVDDRCLLCGETYAQTHEVYFGNNRLDSIILGFQIKLCNEHHQWVHSNRGVDLHFKKRFQTVYEENGSREEFIKIFGRSYL